MIPVIILAIADETSREFMIRFYENNASLMYLEARKYFSREEDVEDIVADAIVKLVDKVDVLQEIEQNKRISYAITTVRHMAFHALDHRNCLKMVSFDEIEVYLSAVRGNSPDEKILREQRNARLQTILGSLPVEDRLLLEKKYILLWTDAEIAKTLNIQPDSVRMRITRAKRRVAKALIEQGFHLDEWM